MIKKFLLTIFVFQYTYPMEEREQPRSPVVLNFNKEFRSGASNSQILRSVPHPKVCKSFCPKCPQITAETVCGFTTHIVTCHGVNDMFACPECNFLFDDSHAVVMHLSMHHGFFLLYDQRLFRTEVEIEGYKLWKMEESLRGLYSSVYRNVSFEKK